MGGGNVGARSYRFEDKTQKHAGTGEGERAQGEVNRRLSTLVRRIHLTRRAKSLWTFFCRHEIVHELVLLFLLLVVPLNYMPSSICCAFSYFAFRCFKLLFFSG